MSGDQLNLDEVEAWWDARGVARAERAQVSALVAEVRRLRAQIANTPRVDIHQELGKPSRCQVTLNGLTLFDGRDYTADIQV